MAFYEGRTFQPAGDPSVDGSPPTGHYHQDGDVIWAEFSGGQVRAGRLVGTARADGSIDAAYCFVTTDGDAVAGGCLSMPTVLPDGRIRLIEHWRRLDGSSGVSQVEEVAR
ncbi:MAG: hypothetical protein M3P23_14315 [Actinomycetota bacterium]|nr:hypothetical protein [Actinomycetota bacterium]